jgi:hypothetical protein
LITTDGTTLLGADDKAGIAEILTAVERIVREKIPHGRICVGFTPDEEIGRGADYFDVAGFGADFAYTLDGGPEGELEYENFNAAEATVEIRGVAVHPGTAKNVMVNALVVACALNSMLPGCETPADTENYEGFYYLRRLEGTPEKVSMAYSLRDHDAALLTARKKTLEHAVRILNERYGPQTIRLEIKDRYRNMAEIIKDHSHLIDSAKLAMAMAGIEPVIIPMRGGTDGATLSYKGLPCPNLGTGGYAYHGVFEHITAEGLELCTRMIIDLVKHYAEKGDRAPKRCREAFMNILDMITSQVNNPSVLGKLGQSVGADTDKVKQLTELGLPALLRAMGRNVKTEEGAQSLAGALDQHQDDPVDDVASFLGQVDMSDGAKILGHLFPHSQTRVQNNLASKTGLDKSQVSGVLSQLAPLLLGTLGQQKKTAAAGCFRCGRPAQGSRRKGTAEQGHRHARCQQRRQHPR